MQVSAFKNSLSCTTVRHQKVRHFRFDRISILLVGLNVCTEVADATLTVIQCLPVWHYLLIISCSYKNVHFYSCKAHNSWDFTLAGAEICATKLTSAGKILNPLNRQQSDWRRFANKNVRKAQMFFRTKNKRIGKKGEKFQGSWQRRCFLHFRLWLKVYFPMIDRFNKCSAKKFSRLQICEELRKISTPNFCVTSRRSCVVLINYTY